MEEDVEIEMLLKSEENILLEAMNNVGIRENHLEIQSLSSDKGTNSSFNKENMIHNEYDEMSSPSALTPKTIEKSKVTCNSNMQSVSTNDNIYNFGPCFKFPNSILNLDSKDSYQVRYQSFDEGADDQINQHILDLMTTDPTRYSLSQQASYTSQFDESDESDDAKDFDEIESSDDDWEDDYGYKDDEFSGDMVEEQFKSCKTSNISSNEVLQKLKMKALTPLLSLAKILFKRGNSLANLENELLQLQKRQSQRRGELQLLGTHKVKPSEIGNLRANYRAFGMPYFVDDDGFHAPPNQDHLQKLVNEEITVHSMPKSNNWTKVHKELMKNAIKKTLLAEKSEKITQEITNLTKMLKSKKGNANKLLEKITENQNELRTLYKKSFKELVESEKGDREYDWMKFSISLYDGLHSAEECKRFWNIYLKPSVNKGPWTNSEDKRLFEIANNSQFQNWEKIAKLLGTNRSAFQCFVHFQTRIEGNSDFSNGKWSKGEDKKLKTVVHSSKIGDFIPWNKVSAYVGHRNLNQIYNRWINALNPEIVKGRFSKDEDILIVTGVEVFGVTFKELAYFMTNRTSSQIRERYERHLLPKTAKIGAWSLDEDNKLLKLVEEFGEQNWAKIAKIMKTRSRTQVRQRYGFIKKMRKKHPDWTVAQVKRRTTNFQNKALKTDKEVADLKKILGNVEKVFGFSGLEKETYVINKLVELQEKISCKHKGKGRKKREDHCTTSKVDDALQSYFANCNMYPPLKSLKYFQYNPYEELNSVILMSKFFGHKLKLPGSEGEVCDNLRLSYDIKCYVLMLLDSNSSVNSKSGFNQQSIISESINQLSESTAGEINSTKIISCAESDNDNTIIMMDWWHTPPINVANLNFSEFFKRTVFDYSNGMHKDIWDAKVRRSKMIKKSDDCFEEHTEVSKPDVQNDQLSFPLNHFSTLTRRHTLIARKYFEKYFSNACSGKGSNSLYLDFIKDEIEDDKVIIQSGINLSSMVKDNLIMLLTWPTISTVIKTGSVPMDTIKRVQKSYKKNKDCYNTLGMRKRKIKEDQEDNFTIGNICQPKYDTVKRRKLNVETKTCTDEMKDCKQVNVKRNSSSTSRKRRMNDEDLNLSVDNVCQSDSTVKKKLNIEIKTVSGKEKTIKEKNRISNDSLVSNKRIDEDEEYNLPEDISQFGQVATKNILNNVTITVPYKEIKINDKKVTGLQQKKSTESNFIKKIEKSNSRKKLISSNEIDSKELEGSHSSLNSISKKIHHSAKRKSSR